ncbi:hypothetical protein QN277_017680 [Acacia crassicarpa]|uniref:Uncharacterized protein n=1 Tax=Acacia crassicarpa TaxID=499986 RepID=A0AAE1JUM9_9FABA|nr:hypothetical protein QN277_017680 [Acacia crassicarpa]
MQSESSLRYKLKSSFLCFSGDQRSQSLHDGDSSYNKLHEPKSPTTPASPSCPKKSSAADYRGRSRHLLSRIRRRHHRHTQYGDFSYDPTSYALNFEDDSRSEEDDFPFRGFADRLKHLPPLSANFTEGILVTMHRELVGFS